MKHYPSTISAKVTLVCGILQKNQFYLSSTSQIFAETGIETNIWGGTKEFNWNSSSQTYQK